MRPWQCWLTLAFVLLAPLLAEARTWTDRQGRQIEAKFVRVHGAMVVLERGNRVVTVPFAALSDADQEYVREQTKADGKKGELPPALQRVPSPQGAPPSKPGESRPDQSAGPHQPVMPPVSPPFPPPNAARGGADGIHDERLERLGLQRSEVGPPPFSQPPPFSPPEATLPPPEPAPPPYTPPPAPSCQPPPIPGGSTGPMFQYSPYCGNCRRDLPASVKAGDHCPHCKAFLAYEETPGGGRKYAPTAYTIGRYTGIGLLVALVLGLLSKFLRN